MLMHSMKNIYLFWDSAEDLIYQFCQFISSFKD